MQILLCNQINYLIIPYDPCYSIPSLIILYDDCNTYDVDITYERCNYYLKLIINLDESLTGEYWISVISSNPEIKEKIKINCPCNS